MERAVAEFVIAAGQLEWSRHNRFAGHHALINAIEERTGTKIVLREITYGRVYRDEHGAIARVARLGRGATTEQIEALIHASFPRLTALEIEFSA
jgi:hypothetical protein